MSDELPTEICSVCGSNDVEYVVWFNAKTKTNGECFGTWNEPHSTFCNDCDEHHPLLSRDVTDEKVFREKWDKYQRSIEEGGTSE